MRRLLVCAVLLLACTAPSAAGSSVWSEAGGAIDVSCASPCTHWTLQYAYCVLNADILAPVPLVGFAQCMAHCSAGHTCPCSPHHEIRPECQ